MNNSNPVASLPKPNAPNYNPLAGNTVGMPVNYPVIQAPPQVIYPPPIMPGYIPHPPVVLPIGIAAESDNEAEEEVDNIPPPTVDTTAPLPEIKIPLFQPYTVAVFVGNISDNVSDIFLRQLLSKCGSVISWKRVQGLNAKPLEFGFCEYSDKESALRAVRLLNQMDIAGKELLVKIDHKPQDNNIKLREPSDFERKKLDDMARGEISKVIVEHRDVLNDIRRNNMKVSTSNLDGLGMDENKKRIVSEEIKTFRKNYQDDDDSSDDGYSHKKKSRKASKSSHKSTTSTSSHKQRTKDRDSKKSRDRNRSKSSDDSPHRPNSPLSKEDLEQRRQERKRKEREQFLTERIKAWERREKMRAKDYARVEENAIRRNEEQDEEARQLRDFLENFDDDRDDPLYYSGTALEKRLMDREREIEMDARDSKKEQEESKIIEKTSQKLEEYNLVETYLLKNSDENDLSFGVGKKLSNESDHNVDKRNGQIYQQIKDEVFDFQNEPPLLSNSFRSKVHASSDCNNHLSPQSTDANMSKTSSTFNCEKSELDNPTVSEESSLPILLSQTRTSTSFSTLKKASSATPAVVASEFQSLVENDNNIFSNNEGSLKPSSKVKLTKIDKSEYAEYSLLGELPNINEINSEERKSLITKLVNAIPTSRDQLFDIPIKWKHVDRLLVESRIRRWVSKKIVEYIGEEEETLTEFLCNKILAKTDPREILKDITLILDEEAEIFMVKLWRLLVYETEARHIGLVSYQ